MTQRPVIVGLGEILWDVFPDGPRFGGAPANFACSAAGLARETANVFIAGAVGSDELGQRSLNALTERGVQTDGVEINDRPTGRVLVHLDADGKAEYEFESDAAWDRMSWTAALERLASGADVLCFGTLGQRSEQSRVTIQRMVRATRKSCLRILDINLRPPFWTEACILESLPLANVLKLNDSELPIVAALLGLSGSDENQLQQLRQRYQLQLVALTRGANGSLLVDANDRVDEQPGRRVTIADTVGAGDAFTAALAIGLLRSQPLSDVHRRAADVAAFVCSQPGATPTLPAQFVF